MRQPVLKQAVTVGGRGGGFRGTGQQWPQQQRQDIASRICSSNNSTAGGRDSGGGSPSSGIRASSSGGQPAQHQKARMTLKGRGNLQQTARGLARPSQPLAAK
jgi:hypothetical protein